MLDWLSPGAIQELCRRCREAGLKIALAGSLGEVEIGRLLELQPDWFAVRGAACSGGRNGTLDEGRVRELKTLISSFEYEI